LYRPRAPSFATTFLKQSKAPLYKRVAPISPCSCKRTFTTSMGAVAVSAMQDATPPNKNN
jgi:hypothetical protein